ncbi:acyl-CoA dehydrogenase C-terminal domain-containing protein [Deinococcus peraridilitoris]|uniref:3-methylmercaptopropionyl-CoA dehydrogenase n=1 Tax=Deinococcus peraridilitoris (strain DSM 19664 / LMG 22246 / CIP 109416 / KR-200) TaxID=937777 RepID=L0A5F8_DEIPD|nr:acyl-CoA dehydrogenase C-terminal domain-containing protein [Deinococcus peraridilitoris]AFZ68422.1 acyl-CoA dehydrogenase [Deinococcus peraridilitoris DSM 19664]
MTSYKAPLRDMRFVLHELLHAPDLLAQLPGYEDASGELLDQVLEEAARFCENELHPLNRVGDEEGCSWEEGEVRTPTGFKEAYRKYVQAGWPSLGGDPQYGGQGLPYVLGNNVSEMLDSANMAWAMYPGLSQGAYRSIHSHASEDLKQTYLPKLLSGEWTGTMCLTEPHAGTDLGLLRTRARELDDGSYAVTGTKIFISAGEHDFAENIVHLVLARIEGAPQGVKGISLFIVPKFLVKEDGSLGERNTVMCGSIEHKMGIKGSATAVLNFDDARGYLVGQPGKGLAHMFTMMNGARLGTALQGLGVAEASYQNALAYARDRLQMRAPVRARPDESADPIIVHPDVRRMLLTMKAYNEGARALSRWLALQLDVEHAHPDAGVRADAADLVALLTPVAKAFMTDNGTLAANLGMQVLGGHGYIREWGMEQFVRDARIAQIYEGTNGIQALDLLGRKVLGDGGQKLQKFGALIQAFLQEHEGNGRLKEFTEPLGATLQQVRDTTMLVGGRAMQNPDEANGAAVDYLRLLGHLTYAYLWARMASASLDKEGDFYTAKLHTARFYFQKLLPETRSLVATIKAGSASLTAMPEELFAL